MFKNCVNLFCIDEYKCITFSLKTMHCMLERFREIYAFRDVFMCFCRRERASSRITTKAFEVLVDPGKSILEETEDDSSTFVSVSSVVSSTIDSSEPELQHSTHLKGLGESQRSLQRSRSQRSRSRSPVSSRSQSPSRSPHRSRSPHSLRTSQEIRSNLGRSPVGVQGM
jgi:hypothetical protein